MATRLGLLIVWIFCRIRSISFARTWHSRVFTCSLGNARGEFELQILQHVCKHVWSLGLREGSTAVITLIFANPNAIHPGTGTVSQYHDHGCRLASISHCHHCHILRSLLHQAILLSLRDTEKLDEPCIFSHFSAEAFLVPEVQPLEYYFDLAENPHTLHCTARHFRPTI